MSLTVNWSSLCVHRASRELIARLHERDVKVYLVTGGFAALIEPLADSLGIPRENIFANHLQVRQQERDAERVVGPHLIRLGRCMICATAKLLFTPPASMMPRASMSALMNHSPPQEQVVSLLCEWMANKMYPMTSTSFQYQGSLDLAGP